MNASQLQDRLIVTLTRTAGRDRRHWRIVVGPVRVYDPATHPHCNWSVAPSGDARENDIVETLLDSLRLAHPRVDPG